MEADDPSELRSMEPEVVVRTWVEAMDRHDLETAVSCFDPEYDDVTPTRPGREFRGQDRVRANFAALFESVPNLRAELLDMATNDDRVWMEWRMHGTRVDGSPFAFAGVNIFGIRHGRILWGRIYTDLVQPEGDIDEQVSRMTGRPPGVD